MSRQSKQALLECFPVPEAGVFSVYTYEVQYGEIQTHVYNELHDIIIKKTENSTLSHAVVSTVSGLSVAGVCAACTFTNDSTARGCTIELHNDEHTFVFNMSRQSKQALLECFPVPEAGVFSVSVYEVLQDGSVGQKVWRLPDVTISAENTSLSVRENKTLLY
jgi:hypothetical protein